MLDIAVRTTGRILPDRGAIREALRRGMSRAVLRVLTRARQNLSGRFLRVATGRLRSSVTTRVFIQGDAVMGVIGTNVFYGKLHEFGVAHSWPIVPTRKTALKFTVDGKTIFARRVMHPPLPARPWLRTALTESARDIEADFRLEVGRLLNG